MSYDVSEDEILKEIKIREMKEKIEEEIPRGIEIEQYKQLVQEAYNQQSFNSSTREYRRKLNKSIGKETFSERLKRQFKEKNKK